MNRQTEKGTVHKFTQEQNSTNLDIALLHWHKHVDIYGLRV